MRWLLLALAAIVGWLVWHRPGDGPPPPLAWDRATIAAITADLGDARGEAASAVVLAHEPRMLLYFTAGWCPYCTEFDPELIAFYEAHGGGRRFQLLVISRDESAADMRSHLRASGIPGWAVRHGSDSARRLDRAYSGKGGIPCLVLLDGHGRVLSHSYEQGRYVGPDHVLEALDQLLASTP